MSEKVFLTLQIKGMTCDHCQRRVEQALMSVEGIERVIVGSWKDGKAHVVASERVPEHLLIDAITKAGYSASVIQRQSLPVGHGDAVGETAEFDLIILGGGSAAFAAALRASEMEKRVLLMNDGLPIGGTCVNVGCVPSKTLIRTAEAYHRTRRTPFGAITLGNSSVDFRAAIREKRALVESLRTSKYVDNISDDPHVRLLHGRGTLVSTNAVAVGKSVFRAPYILIATGSSPSLPDIPGLASVPYLTNETLYELETLPEHIIILGGRYIAVENAQMLARFGAKVTILQRSPRILPHEMPEISETLTAALREEGIAIETSTALRSVACEGERIVVHADVGGEERMITGSHLMVATGRKGNTQGLRDLGIRLYGSDFVATDEFLRTSVPNIFAAGDVTGRHLFVYTAAYEGALAIHNMFGDAPQPANYHPLPWVIFTDPQVAGVGHDEKSAHEAGITYDVSVVPLKEVPRARTARNTIGFIKLLRNSKDDTLIGARIVATEGSELLMEIALAIKYRITVQELKQMFHPYLTLSEAVKLAAIGFDKDVKKLSCCAV